MSSEKGQTKCLHSVTIRTKSRLLAGSWSKLKISAETISEAKNGILLDLLHKQVPTCSHDGSETPGAIRDANSHFLLLLVAAGQLVLLVQEVDEGHHQQEQQNTHHHGDDHGAGASLLLIGYSVAGEGWYTWRGVERDGRRGRVGLVGGKGAGGE